MPRLRLTPIRLGLAALTTAALSGCGFTPLYATPGMTPALASIDVVAPLNESGATSREGYFLRLKLNDELGRDPETPSRYRLTTTVKQSRVAQGARVNNIASRYELDVSVIYVLSDGVTGEVLTQGTALAKVSYDSSDPPLCDRGGEPGCRDPSGGTGRHRRPVGAVALFPNPGRSQIDACASHDPV